MKCLMNKENGIFKKCLDIIYILTLAVNKSSLGVYLVWVGICIVNSVLFVLSTIQIQRFLDSIQTQRMNQIYVNLINLILLLIVNSIFSGLSVWGDMLVEKTSLKVLKVHLLKKIENIEPWNMQKDSFADELEKCKNGLESTVYIIQTLFFMISWHIPYFIFMSIYLYRINHLFIGFLFVILISVLVSLKIKKKTFKFLEEEKAEIQRKIKYYIECVFDINMSKETIVLNAKAFFKKKYQSQVKRLNSVFKQCGMRTVKIDFYEKMSIAFVYILIISVLFRELFNENITVGVFIAIFTSIERMFTMIRSIVINNLGFVVRNMGGVQFFLEFMKKEEQERIPLYLDYKMPIYIHNISFHYPQGQKKILKNISFTIHPKETIVIVGENGAGKSTLVKLILGIYVPEEGYISYGNVNNKARKYFPLNTSAIFQDFHKYKLCLRDNISISEVEKCHLESLRENVLFTHQNDNVIINDLKRINVYGKLKNIAMDTMLCTEFGGIDLSGGTWQKLSTARCLFRDASLVVLDEPTSAIDPIEESKVYELYREICKNKTAIIVSHRLGICKLADRIVVMDNGEIIDIGTHTELLKNCLKYKNMWISQSDFYNF